MKDILEAFREYNIRRKEYDDMQSRFISGRYLVNVDNYEKRLKIAEEELGRAFNKAIDDSVLRIINSK